MAVLLELITRLARAYNTVVPSSGKVLTGGVDANVLQRSFFGAARNIEEAVRDNGDCADWTGSRMDDEPQEFKGTGNSEVILDHKLSVNGHSSD